MAIGSTNVTSQRYVMDNDDSVTTASTNDSTDDNMSDDDDLNENVAIEDEKLHYV